MGPIRNGKFEDCEFVNNKGCGLVADSGDSGFCDFKECIFWGMDAWSIWVTKPGFSFNHSRIYGSFVHGYNAATDREATKFIDCHFEDRPYKGRDPYGGFLVESNGMKRVSFTGCRFISHKKKALRIGASSNWKPEEKYQFRDCRFTLYNNNLPQGDFVAVIRGLRYSNCTFEFKNKEAKKKGYYLNDCCEPFNTDAGGNRIIYSE